MKDIDMIGWYYRNLETMGQVQAVAQLQVTQCIFNSWQYSHQGPDQFHSLWGVHEKTCYLLTSNTFVEFACCPQLVHVNGVLLVMWRFFHASACKWKWPGEETWHITCCLNMSQSEKIKDSRTVGQICCCLLLVVAFATPNCNGWEWPANSARCGCFTSSLRPGSNVQTCHKRRWKR